MFGNEKRLKMKAAIISITFALSLLALGCATPYQSRSFGGGYSDTQLSPDVFRVFFRGNAYTSMERSQDFALLHAAELAKAHGFAYFAVVDENSSTSSYTYVTPAHSETSGSATFTGNFATYSGSTTYHPAQTYTFYTPRTGLLIKCFSHKPKGIYSFDAGFLEQSIRQKYGLK